MPLDSPKLLWAPLDEKKSDFPLRVRINRILLDNFGLLNGGDEEDRTPVLRIANATLSQLSYVPEICEGAQYNKVLWGALPGLRLIS